MSTCLIIGLLTASFILFYEPNDLTNEESMATFNTNINSDSTVNVLEQIGKVSTFNIFKVDTKEILSQISKDDLGSLEYIVKQLPNIEVMEIENISKDTSLTSQEKIIQINNLLKKRLSEDDYEKIKKSLENYINFESIEELNLK